MRSIVVSALALALVFSAIGAAAAPATLGEAIRDRVTPQFATAAGQIAQGRPVDTATLDAALQRVLADWPDAPEGWEVFAAYLRFAQHGEPARTEREVLALFVDSPNRSVREFARNRLDLDTWRETPLELQFTALDGRAVDLAALRGQVVLIDFWATWCQPCLAELPNVRRVYADFHDRGFEIVGVSLDEERNREKFTRLVAERDVPWPQRFAGQGWNDAVARRFAVAAIPATFLLDRRGCLVATDLSGERLRAAVAEQLADAP